MIFFVLSGFLVGGNLIERAKIGRFRIGDYAIDRATRILIPLFPACALTVALNSLAFAQPADLSQLFGNALGLSGVVVGTLANNAPLWSLAYEIWFYVLAGCVVLVLSGTARPLVIGIMFLCVVVFSRLDARYVLFWGAGALTAQIVKMPGANRLCVPGLLTLILGIACYQMGSGSKSLANFALVPQSIAEALICCGFSLCIPYLCNAKLKWLAAIEGPVRLLSHISFSLYLVHYPMNAYLTVLMPKSSQIDLTSVEAFLLKTTVSICLSIAFWLLFERPSFGIRKLLKMSLRLRLV